jgi:hypothetical protein
MTAAVGLAYAHLNLRFNPFGEMQLCERAHLAVVEIEHLADLLGRPGVAIQFLGEPGRGKTTHLLALKTFFPDAPYVHLHDLKDFPQPLPPVPRAPLLFIDESQRLSPWRRFVLFRRSRSLVLGSHEDHTRQLERRGFEVLTVQVASNSAERLKRIIDVRIERARRAAGPLPQVRAETVKRLIERYGDDVRAVEGHLYERFVALQGVGDVQV